MGDMEWLAFAMITVFCFGVYGTLLHTGQVSMKDPASGRYKAFLFVGVAYFIVAVLAPLAILAVLGSDFKFTGSGAGLSLVAGALGAVGAFGILLAFGAKGVPVVVMSIVFSGAPIVNAIASMTLHPPEGGLGAVHPMFFVGILAAAVGGCLVTLYKPPPSGGKKETKSAPSTAAVGAAEPASPLPWLDRLSRPAPSEPRMVNRFPE